MLLKQPVLTNTMVFSSIPEYLPDYFESIFTKNALYFYY